jgi:mycothiol synthase
VTTLNPSLHLASQLVIRPIAGEAELPAMAAIAQRCNAADQVDERPTTDTLLAWFRHLVNTDPAEDILLAEVGGVLAGYQYTSWRAEGDGGYRYALAGYVDPAWRRQGLGAALVARGEARLRAVAATHPGAGPRFFQTFTSTTRVGKAALFERRGYHIERHFYDMLRTGLDVLPLAPLPSGLALRPVDRNDRALLRTIWDANEEAFRDHWGYAQLGDDDFLRLLDDPETDPDLWQVAWDVATNQVAGVSLNTIPAAENAASGRQRGWVNDLSVRRPYRGRGLGRALLVNSLAVLRARGLTEVGLGVDAQNATGALHLYESVGFQVTQHSVALRKPL